MLPQNKPDRIRILFDDHRLVANAGLILPATLALRLGLPQLLRKHLDLGGAPGRANTGDKMMTLVASALAGGDCIDDADVLRAGGTARVLGFTAKPESTEGQGMDGVRTAEGGEGVTGAMIRARIWVDGRLAGGLQALLGAPMAAYSGCGERDGGIGHGKRRSRTGLARVCGDVGLAGGSVADGRRQAGSGMARSRARARLNCSSQGQRRGRCRVNRRAERVIRPAKAKTRRLRVLVVTIC